jgi:hypothetical protein
MPTSMQADVPYHLHGLLCLVVNCAPFHCFNICPTCFNYTDVPCHHTSMLTCHVNTTDVLDEMDSITCLDTASSIWMDLGCRKIRFYSLIAPGHYLDTFPIISPCILVSDHPVQPTSAGVSTMADYPASADVGWVSILGGTRRRLGVSNI